MKSQVIRSILQVLLLQEEVNDKMPALRNRHVFFSLTFSFNPHSSKQVMFLLVPGVAVEEEFHHDYLFSLFGEHGCRPTRGRLNPWWD